MASWVGCELERSLPSVRKDETRKLRRVLTLCDNEAPGLLVDARSRPARGLEQGAQF